MKVCRKQQLPVAVRYWASLDPSVATPGIDLQMSRRMAASQDVASDDSRDEVYIGTQSLLLFLIAGAIV